MGHVTHMRLGRGKAQTPLGVEGVESTRIGAGSAVNHLGRREYPVLEDVIDAAHVHAIGG